MEKWPLDWRLTLIAVIVGCILGMVINRILWVVI